MPWESKKQQRWAHSSASTMKPGQVREFDEATKAKKGGFGKLPEEAHAAGGPVMMRPFTRRRRKTLMGPATPEAHLAYGGMPEDENPHRAAMGEDHMDRGGFPEDENSGGEPMGEDRCPYCGGGMAYADGGLAGMGLPRWLRGEDEPREEEMREDENPAPGDIEEEEDEGKKERRLLHAYAGAIARKGMR